MVLILEKEKVGDRVEKGLLFLTLSVACLWVLLDEFYGTKKISKIAKNFVPEIPNPIEAIKENVDDFVNGTKTDTDKKQDKDKIKNEIDKKPGVSDKGKDALKDAVDQFYNNMPGAVITS